MFNETIVKDNMVEFFNNLTDREKCEFIDSNEILLIDYGAPRCLVQVYWDDKFNKAIFYYPLTDKEYDVKSIKYKEVSLVEIELDDGTVTTDAVFLKNALVSKNR